MKKNTLLAGVAALALLAAVSCKKDDKGNSTPSKSKTELLTNNSSKQWLPTSQKLNGVEFIEDCDKDDVYTFSSNKSLSVAYNTKCDPSDADETGSWALLSNDSKLQMVQDGDTTEANIDVLTETALTISASDGGITATLSFKAK